MEGFEATGRAAARAGLAAATFLMVVSGVVIATDGLVLPAAAAPTVALAPAAVTSCGTAGAYRPPDPGSVGLPAGVTLCPSGPLTITDAGAVVDGWDVRGGIVVDAPDVVVRRSRITGDGATPHGVVTTGAGTVRVEDTTLTGDFPQAAIAGDRWSGARVEVVGVTHDGVHLGAGARLRNSSLHDFAPAPGTEPHGAVVLGDADLLVEDNRIVLGEGIGRGSAVLLAAEGPAARGAGPVVIRGNVLGGGRYSLHQTTVEAGDVRITDNRFLRDAEQGPLRVSNGAVLADNSYVDGGPLPGR